MERKSTMSRQDFIENLVEAGANHNTIQALFNAYTAGAEHMKEECICELQRKVTPASAAYDACDVIEAIEIK